MVALNIQLWGADGGAGLGGVAGGTGGYTICTFPVTPSTTYTFLVGQAGTSSPTSGCTTTPKIGACVYSLF